MSVLEYIALFDKAFNTHISEEIKNKDFTMLNWCSEYMGEELCIPSKKHQEIRNKMSKISAQILQSFSYEQEQLFSDYWELDEEMDYDINQQMLVFGYCLAYQQLKEIGALKDERLILDEQRNNKIDILVEKLINKIDKDRSNLTDEIIEWMDLNLKQTDKEKHLLNYKNQFQSKLEEELTENQIVKLRMIDYLDFRLGEERIITACRKLLYK